MSSSYWRSQVSQYFDQNKAFKPSFREQESERTLLMNYLYLSKKPNLESIELIIALESSQDGLTSYVNCECALGMSALLYASMNTQTPVAAFYLLARLGADFSKVNLRGLGVFYFLNNVRMDQELYLAKLRIALVKTDLSRVSIEHNIERVDLTDIPFAFNCNDKMCFVKTNDKRRLV